MHDFPNLQLIAAQTQAVVFRSNGVCLRLAYPDQQNAIVTRAVQEALRFSPWTRWNEFDVMEFGFDELTPATRDTMIRLMREQPSAPGYHFSKLIADIDGRTILQMPFFEPDPIFRDVFAKLADPSADFTEKDGALLRSFIADDFVQLMYLRTVLPWFRHNDHNIRNSIGVRAPSNRPPLSVTLPSGGTTVHRVNDGVMVHIIDFAFSTYRDSTIKTTTWWNLSRYGISSVDNSQYDSHTLLAILYSRVATREALAGSLPSTLRDFKKFVERHISPRFLRSIDSEGYLWRTPQHQLLVPHDPHAVPEARRPRTIFGDALLCNMRLSPIVIHACRSGWSHFDLFLALRGLSVFDNDCPFRPMPGALGLRDFEHADYSPPAGDVSPIEKIIVDTYLCSDQPDDTRPLYKTV
jgi:hypothetical protein